MIIVDTALQQRVAQERPLQVAMFGAGFMARGVANKLIKRVPGFRLTVICNRTVALAIGRYTAAGVPREQIVGGNSASAHRRCHRPGPVCGQLRPHGAGR